MNKNGVERQRGGRSMLRLENPWRGGKEGNRRQGKSSLGEKT